MTPTCPPSWLAVLTVLTAVSAVAYGCAGAEEGEPGVVVVRDRADFEIVGSPAPLPEPGAWVVDPEPTLEIVAVDGDDLCVFTRVWDGTRLPDGRLLVADEMTMELRVFDPTGAYFRTFGGGGDRPAEFGGPAFLEAVDDSTFVARGGFCRSAGAGEHRRT